MCSKKEEEIRMLQLHLKINYMWVLSLWYLCNLLEVVVAFLQRSCSVQRFPHASVFVQENLTMLLHPVQHLGDRHVEVNLNLRSFFS